MKGKTTVKERFIPLEEWFIPLAHLLYHKSFHLSTGLQILSSLFCLQPLNSRRFLWIHSAMCLGHSTTSRMNCRNGCCMAEGNEIKSYTWADSEVNTDTTTKPEDKQRHCKTVFAIQVSYRVLSQCKKFRQ